MLKKNRKIKRSILLLVLIFLSATSSLATGGDNMPPGLDKYEMRILHNGNYLSSTIKAKILDDDTVLAPLRIILEDSGYQVDWNKSGMVTISKDEEKVLFNSKHPAYKMEKHQGTILVDLDFFKEFKAMTARYDAPNKTIIVKSGDMKAGDIYDYDLGPRTMDAKIVGKLDYRLNGGLALPESDKNPLVIIMHGAHSFNKAELNRYDLGFSYLLKDLRDQGYAALSMNVGINYSFENGEPIENERIDQVFEETMVELTKANQGLENNFGLDLKNKFDLNQVILMGHSRSGQEIFRFADKYKEDDRFKVKGLLALAPARNYEMDYSTVDLPTGIILPQLDGDVDGLDGHWIFDNLMDQTSRRSESQLVYLYGANHNAFNQAILPQDQGDPWFKGEKKPLKAEDQRDFLKAYTGKFVKTVLEDQSLYERIQAQGESLFGYQALLSSFVPGERVYHADEGLDKISTDKAQVKKLVSSNMANVGNTLGFYPPGDSNSFSLLNIQWKDGPGQVAFDITKDVKDKERLVLYLAEDSADKLNKGQNQQIKITLIDSLGKESSLVTDKDDHILRYQPGEALEESYYSTHTPLGFLDLSLNRFPGIDKNKLKTIRLDLTEKDTGALMLRHIQFN